MTLGELETPLVYNAKAGDILNDYWLENEKKPAVDNDTKIDLVENQSINNRENSTIDNDAKEKKKAKSKTDELKNVLYDQKISWFLLIFCCFGQAMSIGFYYCFGVIYVELLRLYPSSESKSAWLGSLGYSVCLFFGIATAALCKEIGCGRVMSLGGAFVGLGLISSSFSSNPDILFLTYGIIMSFGASCLFFSSLLCLPLYFKKYLTVVNGIASAGSGIGGMALSPTIEYLIANYGLNSMFQLYSILALVPICGGFLIRRKEEKKTVNKLEKKSLQYFDKELLRNKAFLLFTFAMSLISFAYYIPYVHLINFSLGVGISTQKASLLPSIICGASVGGKILFGYIGRFRFLNRLYMFQTFLLVISISVTLLCIMKNYLQLCVFAAFFGLFEGGYASFIILSISYVVRRDQLSVAFGMMYTISAMFGLVGPPFAGFLLESSGSYMYAFLTCGGFLMMGVLAIFLMPWLVPKSVYDERKLLKRCLEIYSKSDSKKDSTLNVEYQNEKSSLEKNQLDGVTDNDSGVYSGVYSLEKSCIKSNSSANLVSSDDENKALHEFNNNSTMSIYITYDEGFKENKLLKSKNLVADFANCSHSMGKSLSFITLPPFGSQIYLDRCLENKQEERTVV